MKRKRKYNKLIFTLSGLIFGSFLMAQPISVKAKLDSTQLWIGEQSALTFEVNQKKGQKVQMPLFSDTIVGNLEIVQQAKLDTQKVSDNNLQVKAKYIVTSFQDSLIYIPPFPFVVGKDTVWSNSLSLKVVQPFVIDTTSHKLTDIKPVFQPKFNWTQLIERILLILLVITLLILLYFILKKFVKKKPADTVEKPRNTIPPHIEALQHLDKIREEKLWQHGRIKEYHTELADTIRIYIERMFNINSMEMTSDEILEHAEFLKVDKSSAYSALRQILTLADLVKFAKWNPSPSDNELSLMNAYLFVNQTKIEETVPLTELKAEKEKTDEK